MSDEIYLTGQLLANERWLGNTIIEGLDMNNTRNGVNEYVAEQAADLVKCIMIKLSRKFGGQ